MEKAQTYLVEFGYQDRRFVYYSNDIGTAAEILRSHLKKDLVLDFLNIRRLRALEEAAAS